MHRRDFLQLSLVGGATALAPSVDAAPHGPEGSAGGPIGAVGSPVPAFEFEEATVADLQQAMKEGRVTARGLAELYQARIEALDRSGPKLNSVIELNPEALAIADALDQERKAKGPRGPLHGVPVLIKDNVDTADRMQTTAGSLALVGSIAPRDAFIVSRLREAGAVILGKTNLSEWANFRSTKSSSGWSGRGGQTKNPYVLDRNPCGSSSGSGAAPSANLCAIAVGTETDGSVVCPSNANGLVGIKPTVGLVSRTGIIPISASQDTAGPMARTVADAAVLLAALAGVDPADAATTRAARKGVADYTSFLDPKGLAGARIGVARKMAGFNDHVDTVFGEALEALKRLGAVLVDPADLPTAKDVGEAEYEVLLYEFKDGLTAYFATRAGAIPVKNLQDLIAFNEKNRERELRYFGQEIVVQAEKKGPLASPAYRAARRKCLRLSRTLGIDAVMAAHKLDAIVAPTGGPAWPTDLLNGDHFTGGSVSTLPAVSGYPHVTVPMGFVFGLPVGLSFFGRAWSEPTLVKLGYAFEQETKHRRPPRFLPSAELPA